jgi:hypothetical protein
MTAISREQGNFEVIQVANWIRYLLCTNSTKPTRICPRYLAKSSYIINNKHIVKSNLTKKGLSVVSNAVCRKACCLWRGPSSFLHWASFKFLIGPPVQKAESRTAGILGRFSFFFLKQILGRFSLSPIVWDRASVFVFACCAPIVPFSSRASTRVQF